MVRWFKGNQQFDALVRSNFLDDFKKLDKGQFKEWEKDHYGKLALIILCDQLSRFCYRQKKEAFKFDSIALRLSRLITSDNKLFMQYRLVERMFIILPFMHSEDFNDCELSVKLIEQNIQYAQ